MKYECLLINSILSISLFFIISCSENSPTGTNPPLAEEATINLLNDISETFNMEYANDNPISIQLLDELGEPAVDVFVTFQVIGGDGELLLNDERSTVFNLYTDSNGMVEIIWIPGDGIENFLTISVVETDYSAEPAIIGAMVQENGEVILLSFKWLETNEFQFPYSPSPYQIEYDGRVLESNHFLIFSDESADNIKFEFAALAEDVLYKFNNAFDIDYADLGIFDANTKIMGFTCKNSYLNNPQMFANEIGFLIYGKDSSRWDSWPSYNLEVFRNVVEHELTHLMQFRMGAAYHLCESWFMDGIAEYMSGGVHTPITGILSFNQWRSHPDHTSNPIDAKSLNDLDIPINRVSEYYPAFHLAVKYLLESNDINRSLLNVRDMFFEIAETENFSTAFENCFGISIEYFRDNYYDLITDFLNN